jgi:hypothetical protein
MDMPLSPLVSPSAAETLQQSSHPSLRDLAVEESDAAIVISGRVTSYYLKQLAQETLRSIRGRRQLVNRVVVIDV